VQRAVATGRTRSQHIHGTFKGGCLPAFLAHVAGNTRMNKEAMAALDTQLQAHLLIEYHALAVAQL
jgi:hypothetical protein